MTDWNCPVCRDMWQSTKRAGPGFEMWHWRERLHGAMRGLATFAACLIAFGTFTADCRLEIAYILLLFGFLGERPY